MDALAAADISLFEGFRLDRRGGVLYRRDEHGVFAPIAIGGRALDILGALVERPGDLVSRDEIIEAVWPGTTVEDSNLNVQIAALRRILDDGRAESSCIQTVSGRGYRFVAPVTRVEPAAPPAGTGQPHGPSIGVSARLAAAPRLSIVVLPFSQFERRPGAAIFCRRDHRGSDDRSVAARGHARHFAQHGDSLTGTSRSTRSRSAGSFVCAMCWKGASGGRATSSASTPS